MNTYAVYHRKTLFEIDNIETDCIKLHWPEAYKLVASVEAEDLEQAYTKTQHIDQEWWKNPGVEWLAKSRSTSVSDVIIGPDRHVMVVMGMGFTNLSEEIGHRILGEAEDAFGLRTQILKRAAVDNHPRPVSVPDFLFWLEEEARLQADHLYDDILLFDRRESYVLAIFGLVMELRAWGFTPLLPPDVAYILGSSASNDQGVCHLLPRDQPQTFPNLLGAAGAWLDLAQDAPPLPEIHYLVPVPPQLVEAALYRIQATQAQPMKSVPVSI